MARRAPQGVPRILGITGPIGCGKTTVGDILLELGALERIDADHVVHALMAAGTDTTRRVEEEFGAESIRPDGSVDRRRLASLVFTDPARLRALEALVDPAVRGTIRSRLAGLSGREGVVVIDAIRLLQSEILETAEEVWVVGCSPDSQLHRLISSRGMTPDDAAARIAAQPSFEHPRVTRFIENSGSPADLRDLVSVEWASFLGRGNLDQTPGDS